MNKLSADVIRIIDSYLPLKDYIALHSTCKQLGPCDPLLHPNKQIVFDLAVDIDRADIVQQLMNHKQVDIFKVYGYEKDGNYTVGCFKKAFMNGSSKVLGALFDHPQIVRLLGVLGRHGWETFKDSPYLGGREVYFYAVRNSVVEIFEKFHYDDRLSDLFYCNGVLSLYVACKLGLIGIVKQILAEDLSTYEITEFNKKWYTTDTVLSIACAKGNIEIVRILLNDSRIKPTCCDNLAYRRAVENNHHEIAELLTATCNIKHKFDVNYTKRLRSRR